MIRRRRRKKYSKKTVKEISSQVRNWRRIHYYLGLSIAALLFISAVTGILLGYKKDVDILQPPTSKVEGITLRDFMPLNTLGEIAIKTLQDHTGTDDLTIDRIDVRPDKGIVKVIFAKGNWEVQLNGSSGEVLSIAKRYSDLIEQIHDGSIVSDLFKLITMNVLGFGVLILLLSGIWLWYGPRTIRKIKGL